jgi:hypothetical protein
MLCPSLIPPNIFDLGAPHDTGIVVLIILGGILALAGMTLVEYQIIKMLPSLPQSQKVRILLWGERIAQTLCLLVLLAESLTFLWMDALLRWQGGALLTASSSCAAKVNAAYNQALIPALVVVGSGGLLVLVCANIVGYSRRRMERLVQIRHQQPADGSG